MRLSFKLIEESLQKLRSYHPFFGITFLVCKKGELPVSKMVSFPINANEESFLHEYYKPDLSSEYYFQPFRSSSREGHWLVKKYPHSGSQSTRTRGDLARAFLHEKNSDLWGWHKNYIEVLRKKLETDRSGRVPIFWLAVWIFRSREWENKVNAKQLIDVFKKEFNITNAEINELFQLPIENEISQPLFDAHQYTDKKLLEIVEPAPDAPPEEGGTLKSLELRGVGPMESMIFEPAERLTIITGDNGLGKTFLLESAWWALTGYWAEKPATPRLDAERGVPRITFEIAGVKRKAERKTIEYDWDTHEWPKPKNRPTIPGLIVYARVDGSFAVWDPVKHSANIDSKQGLFLFKRDEIFNGLDGRIEGLLRDWVKWQNSTDKKVFETFKTVLEKLSPPDMEPLQPSNPVRVPGDSRDIPTLAHTYDIVPFINESAGIRRIASIAYLLVWAWNEHQIYSALAKRAPQQKMVVLIDEMEAHLHPKWQRAVLPALLDVIKMLSKQIEPQVIATTHSPLVLASIENYFTNETDKLFHLDLDNGKVKFSEIPFVKYGKIDQWLTSDIFSLKQARSQEGEYAIEKAKKVMAEKNPELEEIKNVHGLVAQNLAESDEFWPRWGYFIENKGFNP